MKRWLFAGLCFWASPVLALESHTAFEYWDLSFFSPSRVYRGFVSQASASGAFSLEYQRTERFNLEDNTFSAGWLQKQRGWAWEIQGSATPSAGVMYRHAETLTFYLPPWLKGFESYAGGSFRRYNESRIAGGFAGLRRYFRAGMDLGARASRSRTQLVNSNSNDEWSTAWGIEAGYGFKEALRFYVWRSGWKEFFESGRSASGAFKSAENGLGFRSRIFGLKFSGSYALEKRSTASSIHKTSLGLSGTF